MNRSKKLLVLLAVLVVLCAATFAVMQYQERQEQIKTSGETVLALPADSVTALSWTYEGTWLSFHRDGVWLYDEDAAFPVSEKAINDLLSPFENFAAAFIIEGAEDLGQYGLDDPLCTISLTAETGSYTIRLGNYSNLDAQRYVSLGDGNVYLMVKDPLEVFDTDIRALIENDAVPAALGDASAIRFSGAESYSIEKQETGGNSFRESDLYYTRGLPLDTSRVTSYLRSVSSLSPTDYADYHVTGEALAAYGLDHPDLTVAIDYPDAEGNTQTFALHVSRDPEQAEEELGDVTKAYLQMGDSPIVYNLTGSTYRSLLSCSYDDLRHREVLSADFDDVTGLEITLDGAIYTLTAGGEKGGRTWSYGEGSIEIDGLRDSLAYLYADTFTDEAPGEKAEISLCAALDLEGAPTLAVTLYRYDGSSCLAVVDGQSFALVPRADVVALIEAVNAIVLN